MTVTDDEALATEMTNYQVRTLGTQVENLQHDLATAQEDLAHARGALLDARDDLVEAVRIRDVANDELVRQLKEVQQDLARTVGWSDDKNRIIHDLEEWKAAAEADAGRISTVMLDAARDHDLCHVYDDVVRDLKRKLKVLTLEERTRPMSYTVRFTLTLSCRPDEEPNLGTLRDILAEKVQVVPVVDEHFENVEDVSDWSWSITRDDE